MSLDYIDYGVDDDGTYKGKIDESLCLLRKPPASSTLGGGVAGEDYEVADWAPLTLAVGVVYSFVAHASNTGACNVTHGGNTYSINTTSGVDLLAGMIEVSGEYRLLYDSVNLVLLNPSPTPATESLQGLAQLATQAEVDAGSDDSKIVTPAKLNAILAGHRTFFFNSATAPSINLGTNTIVTIGKTGDGQDMEWSALDALPNTTTALYLRQYLSLNSSANQTVAAGVTTRSPSHGSYSVGEEPLRITRRMVSSETGEYTVNFWIPVESDVRILSSVGVGLASLNNTSLTLVGFKY